MILSSCNQAAQAKRITEAESAATPSSVTPQLPLASHLEAPARGRWRLVPTAELAQVILWVSHIQISHQGSEAAAHVPFAPLDWGATSAPPSRTREQAQAWAETLAHELRRHPDRFSSYARRYSDDLSTRATGGSLGGTTAAELSPWGAILDALSVLETGGVSEVVETEYGFHIFQLRPPPKQDTVTGAHIVIGYDQAGWLRKALARGPVPQRSRADAQRLAEELYQRAKQDPDRFEALIAQYSDHEDAARAGDVGTWSTHEVTQFPREVEALTRLAIGEVAAPIDSLVGFQIMKRLPNRRRQQFAVESVLMAFAEDVTDDHPSSKASVLATMNQVARALSSDPSRFDEFRTLHCCKSVFRWREGVEIPGLDAPVARLGIGEIAAEPIVVKSQAFLPRRIDANTLPELRVRFELPAPEHADVERELSEMAPELARNQLRVVANRARLSLDLEASLGEKLFESHYHPWDAALDSELPDGRLQSLMKLDEALRGGLNREQYAQYRELLAGQVEESLLAPTAL